MALVTLQVLEGLERGRVYADLPPPVTIGREEDNAIRLNDERVSRFHAKIQEDGGRMILTDLESTNGTRINGHPVQMHVLRPGDRLTIGRSVLLYGSRREIASRAALLGGDAEGEGRSAGQTLSEFAVPAGVAQTPPRSYVPLLADEVLDLFPDGPPELPHALRALQRAQLADLLAFVHERLGVLLATSLADPPPAESDDVPAVRIDWTAWQKLHALQMDLAVYLRHLADPDR
ncbi:MAG: FHA domain-containing protein [Planctomycetales bacterium]